MSLGCELFSRAGGFGDRLRFGETKREYSEKLNVRLVPFGIGF